MSLLGQRYASQEMKTIWSREFKIKSERDLWITVLKTQKRLGLKVTDEVISQYVRVKDVINLQSIDDREMKTKHDVMARIDEFNELGKEESKYCCVIRTPAYNFGIIFFNVMKIEVF